MGGMGTALSLARQGFTNINVWEQAPYLDEVGAGINIPPNLGRILTRWGVMDICKAEGVAIQIANVHGEWDRRGGVGVFGRALGGVLERGLGDGCQ